MDSNDIVVITNTNATNACSKQHTLADSFRKTGNNPLQNVTSFNYSEEGEGETGAPRKQETVEEEVEERENTQEQEVVFNKEHLITSVIQNHIDRSSGKDKERLQGLVEKNTHSKKCLIF